MFDWIHVNEKVLQIKNQKERYNNKYISAFKFHMLGN